MQLKQQAKRWVFAAAPWIDYAVTGFPLRKRGEGGNRSQEDTRGRVLARECRRQR